MPKAKKSISIIDEGLRVEGTLTCEGELIIKGKVEGTLFGDVVVIAREGSVHADTHVNRMAINGTFTGEIRTDDELAILSNGNCSGKIFCKDLVIEPGGVLNGEVVYQTPQEITPEPEIEEISLSEAG